MIRDYIQHINGEGSEKTPFERVRIAKVLHKLDKEKNPGIKFKWLVLMIGIKENLWNVI